MRFDVLTFVSWAAWLATTGCNHHVYSPPARSLPLESAATVGRARSGVALEGASHSAMLGVDANSGTARLRHGVATDVDLSLEGNIIHIQGEPAADVHQNIYVVRIGSKYRFVKDLAVTAGAGFGWHEAGTYFSPDLGIIYGYDNPYIIPFVGLRGLMSVPLRSHPVDTTSAGTPLGTEVGTPQLTGGFGFTHGVRVPIPSACAPTPVRGAIVAGVGTTVIADEDDHAFINGFGGGGQLEF